MGKVIDATKITFDNLVGLDGNPITIEAPKGFVFKKEQRDSMKEAASSGRRAGEAFKRMLRTGIYWISK